MTPRIENLTEKKLIGKRLTMSLANNRTGDLWQNFMSKRREISNTVSNDLISMQVYKPTHFTDFKPTNEFEKWATVEVTNFEIVPTDMETFTLTGGLYAVFDYKGSSSDPSIFQYIFGTWLPSADYFLDDRPHFEVLGDKYKNNDPNSEEEIWIPIRQKNTSH
jgi:AraC family transcriptional regulator